jgi:predicted amidohydrolase
VKVGFIQFNPEFGNKKKNFEKVIELLADMAADLIVLPELFATGYLFSSRSELEGLSEEAGGGETHDFVQRLATAKGMMVCYGFAERNGNRLYNSAMLVSPKGIVGHYRKTHLFFEEWSIFNSGDLPYDVHEYQGTRIGMLICFDYIYPEAMRTLALKGAQIVVLPANLVLHFCPEAMVTRSVENRIFTILADRTGTEEHGGKSLKFIGKSQIVAPNGDVLARTGEEECVRIVEIAPESALDKKVTPYNDIFIQRREDLYFK